MEKSYPLIFLFCLIISGSCNIMRPNCDPINGNFFYGPLLSYGGSSFYGKERNDNLQSLGSLALGGYFYWALCQNYPLFSLRSGLQYNQYGSRLNYGGNGMTYISRDRLAYLTMPILVSYLVLSNLTLEAGPDISYLIGAKQVTEFGDNKQTYRNRDLFNLFQLGMHLGAMYRHDSGIGAFIQYNRGLSSVWPADNGGAKTFNGRISLGINYRLNNLLYREEK